jgi:hypothetical protein
MKKLSEKRIEKRIKAQARHRYSITMYVPVDRNIYYDGYSYRVRVTQDYERTSRSFTKLKKAIKFRDRLLQPE